MLRWMDGFEQYGTTEANMLAGVGGAAAWSQVDDSHWSLSTGNPATGTYHLRMTDVSTTHEIIRRAVGASKDVVGYAYRFNTQDLPAAESYLRGEKQLVMSEFRDVANAHQCRISLGTEGSVYACRNDTLLGRSAPIIAAGGYHHYEVKKKIANTGGYVEVRVNEVTVLNLTGIDTQQSANAETSQIATGFFGYAFDSTVGFGAYDLDDCFLWDNDASDADNTVVDWVGDKGCYYLPVNADTAEADWVLSSGATGYSLLDETTPNDADYVGDSTGAARSIFQVAALPGNVAEVIAMMPVIRARKEESGTVNLRGGVVVGASESYTATDSPSTAFAYMTPTPKTIDPDTGVAWASSANPDLLIERTA